MKVNLHLMVHISLGKENNYYKEIDMPASPHKGLAISESDVVLTIESVIYNINDNSYYCRFFEYLVNTPTKSWDFMLEHGWESK